MEGIIVGRQRSVLDYLWQLFLVSFLFGQSKDVASAVMALLIGLQLQLEA